MTFSVTRKPLLLAALALPLLTAGCATRSSVEMAQASANLADTHAVDARSRADAAQARADQAQASAGTAQTRADGAQARADEATGIGNTALTAAQSDAERVTVLETQLQKVTSRIAYLQHNVVFKKVVHKKKPAKHHAKPKAKKTNANGTPSNS